jgi:hypothetical protein
MSSWLVVALGAGAMVGVATVATPLALRYLRLRELPRALLVGPVAALISFVGICAAGLYVLAVTTITAPYALARLMATLAVAPVHLRRDLRTTDQARLMEPPPAALLLLPIREATGYWHEWHSHLVELCDAEEFDSARKVRRHQLYAAARIGIELRVRGRLRAPGRTQ